MAIITLSGYPGAGKDDVGKLLSKKLGYKLLSVGNVRRKMARERGLTIQEFNELGDPENDIAPDNYQKRLGKTADNFIFEGRLSWKFIPNSFKIFLKVKPIVGAERIYKANRNSEKKCTAVEHQVEINHKRCENDIQRYKNTYDVDNCYDLKHFDKIVDTSNKTQEEVANEIIEYISKKDL